MGWVAGIFNTIRRDWLHLLAPAYAEGRGLGRPQISAAPRAWLPSTTQSRGGVSRRDDTRPAAHGFMVWGAWVSSCAKSGHPWFHIGRKFAILAHGWAARIVLSRPSGWGARDSAVHPLLLVKPRLEVESGTEATMNKKPAKPTNAAPTPRQAIEAWRKLPPAERRRRHLESIPRRVANSMAIEGKPVDEQWLRQKLADHMRQRATSTPPSAP